MNNRIGKTAALALASTLVVLFIGARAWPARDQDKEPKIGGPGAGLEFPKLLWTKLFPADLVDVALAKRSGEVAALTGDKLYYFKGEKGDADWTASGPWQHVQDLGMSWDGQRVLVQWDRKPKKTTEGMELTMTMYDGSGQVVWEKPNPYRYQSAKLSPSGSYILIGELMHHGVKCFDGNLGELWTRDIQFWSITFDPRERYIFDGEVGALYTVKGEPVWNMGPYTRILSVSDDADYVMTQYFRTAQAAQRIFLTGRTALKKIELAGTGGCVSPDGLLTAYVNADQKLVVYRTLELFEGAGQGPPPLFSGGFLKPYVIQISRDNRGLFVMGQESGLKTVMMLVDLDKMETAWSMPVDGSLRVALPTEDNHYALLKQSERSIAKFQLY